MNIECTAALGEEASYSQQTKRLEAVEGVDGDAADLVVAQDAGKKNQGLIHVIKAFYVLCLVLRLNA